MNLVLYRFAAPKKSFLFNYREGEIGVWWPLVTVEQSRVYVKLYYLRCFAWNKTSRRWSLSWNTNGISVHAGIYSIPAPNFGKFGPKGPFCWVISICWKYHRMRNALKVVFHNILSLWISQRIMNILYAEKLHIAFMWRYDKLLDWTLSGCLLCTQSLPSWYYPPYRKPLVSVKCTSGPYASHSYRIHVYARLTTTDESPCYTCREGRLCAWCAYLCIMMHTAIKYTMAKK